MATFVLDTAGHCRVATEDRIATADGDREGEGRFGNLGGSLIAEGTHEDCNTPQTRL